MQCLIKGSSSYFPSLCFESYDLLSMADGKHRCDYVCLSLNKVSGWFLSMNQVPAQIPYSASEADRVVTSSPPYCAALLLRLYYSPAQTPILGKLSPHQIPLSPLSLAALPHNKDQRPKALLPSCCHWTPFVLLQNQTTNKLFISNILMTFMTLIS